ncbi:MAG: hypothetical protein ACYC9K_01085 [Sulfuricaulis sp.]
MIAKSGLLAAMGVVLSRLNQRVNPKPVRWSKPLDETNWNGRTSRYLRGRDYSASVTRSKYLPHNGEREKERPRIGGFHQLHDHSPHYFGIIHAGQENMPLQTMRMCPVCDRMEIR